MRQHLDSFPSNHPRHRYNNKNIYQIEVQLQSHAALPERMIYTWGSIFQEQLQDGDSFLKLKPVISIWILRGKLPNSSPHYHHHFQLWDEEHHVRLSRHCSIHVLELSKFALQEGFSEEDQWLYFLKEAGHWTQLPDHLNNPDISEAMKIVQTISEKQQEWERYRARQHYLHLMATLAEERDLMAEQILSSEKELERAGKELEKIAKEKAQIEQEKTRAEQEKTRAEQEKARAEQEKAQAEQEKAQAEQEKARAEQEKARAEQEKARAEQEKAQAEQAAKQDAERVKQLIERLKALGVEDC